MNQQQDSANAVIECVVEAAANHPPAQTLDVRVGAYWSVVTTTAGAGMASTMRSEAHLHGSLPVTGAGSLRETPPLELAALLRSSSPPEAAVGLAAVNALINASARNLSGDKALGVLEERSEGLQLAMIGRFPFADRLGDRCKQLWVFERGLERRPDDFGEEAMDELLPKADVVAVTATTLLNGTLLGVLARVRPDAFLMMLGPSTPLTPVLFDYGFDILCGTVIDDPRTVLRAVGEGAVTSQITGVRRVSMWRRG
jgi:uncharacterized protein (DUF4213/DUF364 family)